MRVQAKAKFVGTSNRKIGLVAALVRGRSVTEAGLILSATPKRATGPVGKTLDSAIANAENNHNLKRSSLVIESVLVGAGPSQKRMRPRAKGQGGRILKRSSHITVILNDATDAKATSKTTKVTEAKPARITAKPAAKTETKSSEETK